MVGLNSPCEFDKDCDVLLRCYGESRENPGRLDENNVTNGVCLCNSDSFALAGENCDEFTPISIFILALTCLALLFWIGLIALLIYTMIQWVIYVRNNRIEKPDLRVLREPGFQTLLYILLTTVFVCLADVHSIAKQHYPESINSQGERIHDISIGIIGSIGTVICFTLTNLSSALVWLSIALRSESLRKKDDGRVRKWKVRIYAMELIFAIAIIVPAFARQFITSLTIATLLVLFVLFSYMYCGFRFLNIVKTLKSSNSSENERPVSMQVSHHNQQLSSEQGGKVDKLLLDTQRSIRNVVLALLLATIGLLLQVGGASIVVKPPSLAVSMYFNRILDAGICFNMFFLWRYTSEYMNRRMGTTSHHQSGEATTSNHYNRGIVTPSGMTATENKL